MDLEIEIIGFVDTTKVADVFQSILHPLNDTDIGNYKNVISKHNDISNSQHMFHGLAINDIFINELSKLSGKFIKLDQVEHVSQIRVGMIKPYGPKNMPLDVYQKNLQLIESSILDTDMVDVTKYVKNVSYAHIYKILLSKIIIIQKAIVKYDFFKHFRNRNEFLIKSLIPSLHKGNYYVSLNESGFCTIHHVDNYETKLIDYFFSDCTDKWKFNILKCSDLVFLSKVIYHSDIDMGFKVKYLGKKKTGEYILERDENDEVTPRDFLNLFKSNNIIKYFRYDENYWKPTDYVPDRKGY